RSMAATIQASTRGSNAAWRSLHAYVLILARAAGRTRLTTGSYFESPAATGAAAPSHAQHARQRGAAIRARRPEAPWKMVTVARGARSGPRDAASKSASDWHLARRRGRGLTASGDPDREPHRSVRIDSC